MPQTRSSTLRRTEQLVEWYRKKAKDLSRELNNEKVRREEAELQAEVLWEITRELQDEIEDLEDLVAAKESFINMMMMAFCIMRR